MSTKRVGDPQGDVLGEFARYLAEGGLAPNTINNYLADLRALCRWLGAQDPGKCLAELSAADVAGYCWHLKGQVEEGRRPSTIRRHLQSLKSLCRFLRLEWNIDINIECAGGESFPRVLTLEELRAMLTVVRNGFAQAERDHAILQTMLQAGLRVGEVAELRLAQVEINAISGTLRLNGERVIPLNSSLRGALKKYLQIRPANREGDREQCLFLTRDGKPLSKRAIQKLVVECARKAGLEGVSARTLRSTCARYLLEETGDLELVSRLLGHARLETTGRYLHSPRGRNADEALEAYSLNEELAEVARPAEEPAGAEIRDKEKL